MIGGKNHDFQTDINEFSLSKDQEIHNLKIRNKKKIYIIIYLISGFLSILIVLYLKQYKIKSPDISNAISGQIEAPISFNSSAAIESKIETKDEELSAVEIYKKCAKSVVGIIVNQNDRTFFGNQIQAQGSGVIIRSDGYILTNAHVIGECYKKDSDISVILDDETPIQANLIGKDEVIDLAVIKINKSGLPVIKFGDSASLSEGEKVFAIGNPQGLQRSMTDGIISALNRKIGKNIWSDSYIQTNADINPGNSGGALIDSKGNLIGINTAKLDESEGIGFAIPSNIARKASDDLINKGRVVRPAIGIRVTDDLIIKGISRNSDLKKFAKEGDIIVGINNKSIKSSFDLVNEIKNYSVGDKISISVQNAYSKIISLINIELKELESV